MDSVKIESNYLNLFIYWELYHIYFIFACCKITGYICEILWECWLQTTMWTGVVHVGRRWWSAIMRRTASLNSWDWDPFQDPTTIPFPPFLSSLSSPIAMGYGGDAQWNQLSPSPSIFLFQHIFVFSILLFYNPITYRKTKQEKPRV